MIKQAIIAVYNICCHVCRFFSRYIKLYWKLRYVSSIVISNERKRIVKVTYKMQQTYPNMDRLLRDSIMWTSPYSSRSFLYQVRFAQQILHYRYPKSIFETQQTRHLQGKILLYEKQSNTCKVYVKNCNLVSIETSRFIERLSILQQQQIDLFF